MGSKIEKVKDDLPQAIKLEKFVKFIAKNSKSAQLLAPTDLLLPRV